ncbi:MAG: hypothetical protein O2V44_00915 [Candidatus Bathyarchaeota archaeon]|nr:hypothetical protein [Candidatus Bathyarchaeota archaeon]
MKNINALVLLNESPQETKKGEKILLFHEFAGTGMLKDLVTLEGFSAI